MEILKGFLPEKEVLDSKPEDYVLGSAEQQDLSGISDDVAGIVWALFAWTRPINGIYPKSDNPINHASLGINEDSKKYLPDGTVQRGREDWMNCTSNAPCNELEIQFNYGLKHNKFSPALVEWFKEVGFINPDNGKFEIADAWSSIGSGTTRTGNSLWAPINFIRKNGIVPKSKMPDDKSMTWDEYHSKKRMTPELKAIADELLKYIEFGYEKVYSRDFVKFTKGLKWDDFDSYVDPVDGDYIKRLAPDYKFMSYGYHLTINQIGEPQPNLEDMSLQLIKGDKKPEIYLVNFDGKKFHIEGEEKGAPNAFDEYFGKTGYSKFITKPQAEVDAMPEGKPISLKGDTLLQMIKSLILTLGKKK